TSDDERNIFLAWTDNSSDETGFIVERRIEGRRFSQLGVTGPNQTQFADVSIAPGGVYTYRVRARSIRGVSAPSNRARMTTLRSPTGFTGAAAADGSAT